MADFYHWQNHDLYLKLKIQPKASKNEFAEQLGDALKVRLTAPPIDGKANKQLIAFLAKAFKVAKSRVKIISGETGRNKQLKITSPEQLPDFINTPD